MKHLFEAFGLWIVICAVFATVLALCEEFIHRQTQRSIAKVKCRVMCNVRFTAGLPPDTTMRIRLGQDEIPRPAAPHLQHRTYMVGRSGLIADTREDTPPDANKKTSDYPNRA